MKETTKALTSCMILEITYKLLSVTSIQVNFGRAGQKIGEKDTIFQVRGKSLMYETMKRREGGLRTVAGNQGWYVLSWR